MPRFEFLAPAEKFLDLRELLPRLLHAPAATSVTSRSSHSRTASGNLQFVAPSMKCEQRGQARDSIAGEVAQRKRRRERLAAEFVHRFA